MSKQLRMREQLYLASTCFSLFVIGWSDGTTGPLLPRMQDSYNIGYIVVSMIFICNCVGCVCAAVMNMWIADKYGYGKTVVVGAILQSAAFAIQSARPPFPLMALSYTIGGFGWSLGVAQSNNFIAGLPNGMHAKLMVGHGCYGLGALVAPLVSTQFAQFHKHWSFHYLISLALSLSNVASLIMTFRFRDQKQLLHTLGVEPPVETGDEKSEGLQKYRELMSQPLVHLAALFIFVYVGVEVTMGAWSVTYLIKRRHGGPSSGYVSSGFFGGMTLGRFALIGVNRVLGENKVVYLYAVLCVALELTVWLVPSLWENAIAISFVGFFLGPMYPTVVMMLQRTITPHYLGGAIGWMSCNGSIGAAAFPFVLALMAEKLGVQVLQPLMIGLLGGMLVVWTLALFLQRKIRAKRDAAAALQLHPTGATKEKDHEEIAEHDAVTSHDNHDTV